MNKLHDWVDSTSERKRLFAEERLIVAVAEEVLSAMARAEVSKAEVAERLNKSKAFVTQVLSGSRNMTLRTLADIAHSIGSAVHVSIHRQEPLANWQPLNDVNVIQFRSPVMLSGMLDAGNTEWQGVIKAEVPRIEAA